MTLDVSSTNSKAFLSISLLKLQMEVHSPGPPGRNAYYEHSGLWRVYAIIALQGIDKFIVKRRAKKQR